MLAGLRSILEIQICFSSHLGCWLSPVPCCCFTEVPIFSLAVSGATLSSQRSLSGSIGPLYFRDCNSGSNPSHTWNLCDISFCPISFASSLRKFSFKELMNRNRLTDLENKLKVTKRERWGGGINHELGINIHTLLYIR